MSAAVQPRAGWVILDHCDDIIYVDLQYDYIFLTSIDGFVCSCGLCSHPWSVCEVIFVPYVDAVIVRHVCTVGCVACVYANGGSRRDGDGNAAVGNVWLW